MLQYPDFSKPFIVSCDASNYGIGRVLNQNFDGKNLPISYASRTLSDVEVNYSTIEKELLAILFSVETFRPYLYGRRFTLETDHRPLVWLHNVKNPNSKLVLWRYRLNEYDYEIIYKKGITNSNADALSRNPCDEIMQAHHNVVSDTQFSKKLDPVKPFPTSSHKVLIPLSRTPVSPQHQPKNINDDICVEDAFLGSNTECQAKYFPCQVIKERTSEPDSSDDAFETANEYSDDEDNVLIIWSDYEEGDKSGGSRNDEDDDDSGRLVPEIRLDGVDHVELNNKFTTVNFEFGNSKQKYAKKTVGETLVFTSEPKHFIKLHLNKIARKTTYPCFPISQEESNRSTSEYSCIQLFKEKLFMRDDNLLIFIPSDCKITTETGQELIKENRLQYDDIQREDPDNLQVGNVIVIKYEHCCIFNVILKQTFDSKPYLADIVSSLWALKYAMDELKVESVSVSRVGNGLNKISWSTIEDEFRKIFGQRNYKITVCYGKIEIPPETNREEIIHEYHCSVTGGYKGSTKTYDRIREHFYWLNMRDQIRKFVRECESCTPSEAFEIIEMDILGP